MASEPTEDTLIAVSGEASQEHIEKFYKAVQNHRELLSAFYTSPAQGQPAPTILFNGNVSTDAEAYGSMLKSLGPISHDVQCYDCQVINPTFSVNDPKAAQEGRCSTLAVLVSGTVRIGPHREADLHGFSESFVLVPNPAYTRDRRNKTAHKWLIQSSCFRFVS